MGNRNALLERQSTRADSHAESALRRLEDINKHLRLLKLVELQWVGDHKRGEFELLGINSINKNRWFAIVEFSCLRPDGTPGVFFMKFARDGAERRGCIVHNVITDPETGEDFIAIVRQHRPSMLIRPREIGAWQNEIPRMWGSTQVQVTEVDRLISSVMKRVTLTQSNGPERQASLICSEMMDLYNPAIVSIDECSVLAENIVENSGDAAVLNDLWLIRMTMIDRAGVMAVRGTREHRIRLIPLLELVRDRKKHGLTDDHSGNALLFLWEHMNFLRP